MGNSIFRYLGSGVGWWYNGVMRSVGVMKVMNGKSDQFFSNLVSYYAVSSTRWCSVKSLTSCFIQHGLSAGKKIGGDCINMKWSLESMRWPWLYNIKGEAPINFAYHFPVQNLNDERKEVEIFSNHSNWLILNA